MISLDKENKFTRAAASQSSPSAAEAGSGALSDLGQISFINALPVVHPLVSGKIDLNCRQVFGTPSELNAKLASGKLHMGAMSSYFFLASGDFNLFKQISISGSGKVGSVLLFSKYELADLKEKQILVPTSSATSIKLLHLLFAEEYGFLPELIQSEQLLQTDPDAVLLIGDLALNHDLELSRCHLRVDLAQWWHKRFTLPFVFGVWGARTKWVESEREHFEQISEALISARDLGLTGQLSEVIQEAGRRTGLSPERLSRYYLDELDYKFEKEHEQALLLFKELCFKHALL